MKILYVDPFTIPGSMGGSHKSLLDIMGEMKKRGNDVIFASSTFGNLIIEAEKLNIKCILFKMPRFKSTRIVILRRSFYNYFSLIQIFISFLIATYSLWRIIHTVKPTIVHSNERLMAIPVGFASTLAKIPSVAHVRWMPSDKASQFVINLYNFVASINEKPISFWASVINL